MKTWAMERYCISDSRPKRRFSWTRTFQRNTFDYVVLNANGEGDSFTVAKGIIAVDQGADLINLSLGGMRASVVMDNAIRYAKSNDVLLVSAVGNDGVQGYPIQQGIMMCCSCLRRCKI